MSEEINLPVIWQEDSPPQYEGLYFIAVRYPHGFGSYDIAEWDGAEWKLGYSADVAGWVTMKSFLDLVKAGWPPMDSEHASKPLTQEIEKLRQQRKTDSSGEEDWVET